MNNGSLQHPCVRVMKNIFRSRRNDHMMGDSRKIFCPWRTFVLLVLIPLLLWTGVSVLAADDPVGRGGGIFGVKCSSCHTLGGGRTVGPDLRGITEQRQKDWLEAFISDPDKMFNSKDPIAMELLNEYKVKMPALGLSKDEVSEILAFLGAQKGAAQTAAPARVAPNGDAGQGKSLFMGSRGFRNGGAPCMSCHSVAGISFLGGGNLGPELTRAYSTYGEEIVSVLTNIPFPTMVPIFKKHPLSPEEADDLATFFKGIAASQPQDFTPRVLIIALMGFLVLMLIIGSIWRRRLLSVREEMVESSGSRGKTR
jgi:mono/diheme cytochrome c family protein